MKTLLWLDDMRNPFVMPDWLLQYAPEYHYEKDNGTHQIVWVTDHNKLADWITENGVPTVVGFDHDLGIGKHSGYDSAKWLVQYCAEHNVMLPQYFIQSANPVGKENIDRYLQNAKKHMAL